jgi:hypothetical protein
MEEGGGAGAVQAGGAAAVAGGGAPGLDDEAGGAGDLPVEVARVERGAPDRFVDPAELGDGELAVAEGGAER